MYLGIDRKDGEKGEKAKETSSPFLTYLMSVTIVTQFYICVDVSLLLFFALFLAWVDEETESQHHTVKENSQNQSLAHGKMCLVVHFILLGWMWTERKQRKLYILELRCM